MPNIYSDEEVVKSIMEYITKYPNANRYNVIKNSLSSEKRIRDLEKRGIIKLPKAQPIGHAWGKNFIYANR